MHPFFVLLRSVCSKKENFYVILAVLLTFFVAENILIGPDYVKFCDFGLVVDIGEKTSNVGYCGTVPYMPKELFCRGGEYRPSVDIYELGGVMLYLLSGERPWAGINQSNTIIFKVCKE